MPDSHSIVPFLPFNPPLAPPDLPIAEPIEIGYYGGPLLAQVQVFTIFWGDLWAVPPFSDTAAKLNDFFDYLLVSPFMELLREYDTTTFSIGKGHRTGSATITANSPELFATVSDGEIQAQLLDWIVTGAVPEHTPNTLYFIYTGPLVTVAYDGANSCGNGPGSFCGYHEAIGDVAYAVVPYIECRGCQFVTGQLIDNLTTVSSHELAESITDSIPPNGPPLPIYPPTAGFVPEIGDPCVGTTFQLGEWLVQSLYSGGRGRCSPVPVLRSFTWAAPRTWQEVDTFSIGPDGSVSVRTWTSTQQWANYETTVVAAPGQAQQGAFAAVPRWPLHEDVFWIGPDNTVRTNLWDFAWGLSAEPFDLPGAGDAAPGAVAAVSVRPWQMDVFWIRPDGSVATYPFDESTGWDAGAVREIAGPGSAQPGCIAALVENPISPYSPPRVDVFWIGTAGQVTTMWWDGLIGWNPNGPINITDAGEAQPGAITAVSRDPESLEVFWIGTDGTVRTTGWALAGGWTHVATSISGSDYPAQPGNIASVGMFPDDRVEVFWLTPWGAIASATSDSTGATWDQSAIGEVPGSPQLSGVSIAALVRTAADRDVVWEAQGGLALLDGHQPATNDPVDWSLPYDWQ